MANAAAGRKFGRENPISLSAGVVDIFNRTSSIVTTMSDDYLLPVFLLTSVGTATSVSCILFNRPGVLRKSNA